PRRCPRLPPVPHRCRYGRANARARPVRHSRQRENAVAAELLCDRGSAHVHGERSDDEEGGYPSGTWLGPHARLPRGGGACRGKAHLVRESLLPRRCRSAGGRKESRKAPWTDRIEALGRTKGPIPAIKGEAIGTVSTASNSRLA